MASPKKKIPSKPASTRAGAKALGALPEWNLADLYPALDAPEIKRDLVRVEEDSTAFEQDYKGKLADIAAGPEAGPALTDAVRRYEVLDELMGRLISYAGLVHAGNTTDPVSSKFYGDVQERLTASSLHRSN
jgi:oligoendopeptidase F